MDGLTEREIVILDELWGMHGYFIDSSYNYNQVLLDWAIEQSNHFLSRKRIQVP